MVCSLLFIEFATTLSLLDADISEFISLLPIYQVRPEASLAFLVVICIISKCLLSVSLIRCIYLVVFAQILKWEAPLAAPLLVCCVVLLILDVLSTIDHSIYTQNRLSERFNELKLVHYGAAIGSVMIIGSDLPLPVRVGVVGLLFLGLFTLRCSLPMDDPAFSSIFELQYLACCVLSAVNISQAFGGWSLNAKVLLVAAASGLLFELKCAVAARRRKGAQKMDPECLTQELFPILRYLSGGAYSGEASQQLQDWLLVNKDSFAEYFRGRFSVENKGRFLEMFHGLLRSSSDEHNAFEDLLLRAQMEFIFRKNVIETSRLLRLLRQFTGVLALVRRVLVWRVEADLLEYMQYRFQAVRKSEFEEYLENLEFMELMLRGACAYKLLWAQRTDSLKTVYGEIREVVRLKARVRREFQALQYCTKETIANFSLYLYSVERNIEEANRYLRDFLFFSEADRIYANCDNIMLHLSVESDSLGSILNCSANIIGKLGYNKRQLYGESVNVLVPEFFRNYHTDVMQRHLRDVTGSNFFKFKKHALCESINHELLEFDGVFRILPLLNEVTYMGCLTIVANREKNYWIALEESGQILMSYPEMAADELAENEPLCIQSLATNSAPVMEQILRGGPVALSYVTDSAALVLRFKLFSRTEVPGQQHNILLLKTYFE